MSEELRAAVAAAREELNTAKKILAMRQNRFDAAERALAEAVAPFKPGDVVAGFEGARFTSGVIVAVVPPKNYGVGGKAPTFEYNYVVRGIKKDGEVANVNISEYVVWQNLGKLTKTGTACIPAAAVDNEGC